jgi:hypothetical protein
MKFTSYSQAGQDQWVFDTLVVGAAQMTGTFLDIGCADPVTWNNTYALELVGWRGLLADNDSHACQLCRAKRQSLVIQQDVTKMDWSRVLPPYNFDYLSLDVDSATQAALECLLRDGVTWRMATIEHDSYRFGPGPRSAMRKMLYGAGYVCFKEDVCATPGMPFEDWWVNTELAALLELEANFSELERQSVPAYA